MDPFEDNQQLTSEMFKTSTLVQDLCNTIEYISMGIASISFHQLQKTTGNVWAIRGPKKNLVIMLHYQNEFGLQEEVDDVLSIKQELNENFAVERNNKEFDPDEHYNDECAVVTEEVESALANIGNSLGRGENSTFELKTSTACESIGIMNTNAVNVTDLTYFQCLQPELKHESNDSISMIQHHLTYVNCEGAPENKKTKISKRHSEKVVIDTQSVQLLNENSAASSETMVPQTKSTNSKNLLNINICDKIETIKLKQCYVLLEPLDMSNFGNMLQKKFSKDFKPNEGKNSCGQCSHYGKKFENHSKTCMWIRTGETKLYNCKMCNSIKLHHHKSKLNHKIDTSEDTVFHCTECTAVFSDVNCFIMHMKENHFHKQEKKTKVKKYKKKLVPHKQI